MKGRLKITQLKLKAQHKAFIAQYVKDFNPGRAAEACGYSEDTGYTLLQRDDIKAALNELLDDRLEACHIDLDWLLMEMVDNHLIARQTNNLAASNSALNMIAKHSRVDAYAAEKLHISGDDEIARRLEAGRKRNAAESFM